MNQEIDYLLMMSDKDIDYKSLSEETLEQLALVIEIEPYIANSALMELLIRNSPRAASTAWKILSTSTEERYLRSTALKIVFKMDREKALDYMIKHARKAEIYLINTMIEILIYETDFKFELCVAAMIQERLKNIKNTREQLLNVDLVEDFIGALKPIQG
jgi:hypothetical protein